jgi:hypothetical protein
VKLNIRKMFLIFCTLIVVPLQNLKWNIFPHSCQYICVVSHVYSMTLCVNKTLNSHVYSMTLCIHKTLNSHVYSMTLCVNKTPNSHVYSMTLCVNKTPNMPLEEM